MKTTVTSIVTRVKIDAEGERIDLPGTYHKPATVEPYEATISQEPVRGGGNVEITVRGAVIKKDGTPGLNSSEGTWSSKVHAYLAYPHISTAREWVQNLVAEVTR